ncbi:MAG TPA: hypothetical protein PKY82_04680 [Pyrinomonadaceae bacterium]|nr:hypothetical protein [Pyrinomonadaceae bacterium]
MKQNPIKILIAMLLIIATFGQSFIFAQTAEQTLSVTVNFKAEEAITSEFAIEISLSRALSTGERIAVTIGEIDLTSLFAQTENRLVYDAKLMPLPIGESKVTVYLITANVWKEIGRFSLKVVEVQKVTDVKSTETPKNDESKTPNDVGQKIQDQSSKVEDQPKKAPLGLEKFDFLPAFTVSMKSQAFQSNFPIANRPTERATFTDFTLTGSAKQEIKQGGFSADANFDFAGSSFKQEALRFGTLGEKAPNVDLSSYLMNFQVGKAKFSYGHTSFGNNRHLVSSFSARGLSVNIPINKYFDITGGILNGTSIVGFGNFFGLRKFNHQVQGATLGIEFIPKRQNAMRLEITGFNAYIQALSGVSEGRINDAERSRGFGLRFITSDNSERFKLEVGYALSRFQNPQDTQLDPNGNAIPIAPVTRSAHYVETSYQIFKDLKLTSTKNLNLTASFKHEYVEPLYKSLGAGAGADRTAQDYGLDASIGEITFGYGFNHSNDNLRNVPSILKSITRTNRFAMAIPLTALIGKSEKPSPFLPRLGYNIDITHQFGAGIPVNGGFEIDPSTIPDLINTNQSFSSTWQFSKFNFEYRYNRSNADNRQTGRETADQIGWTNGWTIGLNPLTTLSFNVGINLENQNNLELIQINKTKALTFGVNWTPFKGATFASNFSNTIAGDKAKTNDNKNTNFDVQFAYNFTKEKSKFRKVGMQSFVRFADTFARNRDFLAISDNRTRVKILTAGVTFNFF